MNDIISKISQVPLRFYYYFFTKTEDNSIYFESNPDFSDNSRVLFEYMISQGMDKKYHFYWATNQPVEELAVYDKVTLIKKNNKREVVKAIYSSKYVFYTHSMSGWVKKKKNQKFINLWHGCGYKASVFKNTNRKFNLNAKISADKMNFDYVLVPGDVFVQTKSEFFNCSKEKVVPLGYPRYDLMKKNEMVEKQIGHYWGINDKKIIMWMPTYRDANKFNSNNIYFLPILKNDEELKALDKYCEENNVLLIIKKHKNQKSGIVTNTNLSSILFIDDSSLVNMNVQLYSILPYTDALITDYSSIAVDYMLLNKPIAFTLDDYDEYLQKRGFVFENALDYMPGAHVYTYSELQEYIKIVVNNEDLWQERRQELINKMHNPSGNYCERIIEFLDL